MAFPRHTAHGPSRRGATRRRSPRRSLGAQFDRWLDRAVGAAVIVALVVGGIALVLTLLR
ncbi:hypothetical protein [Halomonas urumqiensis]|uniref:Uncharacterized protein n=1 Tax=Halomonas urumqiensis TaxID=1684789 RepID=A0A2N7UJA1_9GAMM|nr:hypothetical protein [Halomonas urumqiensis]PMR80499.1 hypothetical protein C1H70_08575 [Halomonas urumqiensis]PTB01656.1 hypothetical protein C6V82_13300 [Halomonas urumqiensis]GHE22258.1 hypothetical protein GCM10017767_27790 [Halomonas urumqiensis]